MDCSHLYLILILCQIFIEGVRLDSIKLPPSMHPLYINLLSKVEMDLFPAIAEYFATNKTHLPHLAEYLQDYRNSSGTGSGGSVFDNPISTYRLLYRFAKYLPPILKQMEIEMDHVDFPGEDGLFMGSVALLDLQFSYNFSATELIQGKFGPMQTSQSLTPLHILELVKHGLKVGYYVQIWSWLSLLEQLLPNNDKVLELKDQTIGEHDEAYRVKKTQYCFTQPLSQGPSPPLYHSQIEEMFRAGGAESGLPIARNFMAHTLCSNSSLTPKTTLSMKKNLHCWNDPRLEDPYFALTPLKTELLWDSPPILQFHDVVPTPWIERVEAASLPSWEEDSRVKNRAPRSALGYMSFAFLNESELPDGTRVTTRLEHVLNLDLRGEGVDEYKIAVYHTGGDGVIHHDAFRPPNQRHSPDFFADRLGTLLLYMGDVALGGETVFPDIGLKVRPVKGSALYWTHYRRNGKFNWKAWHKGCPTVIGKKWFLSVFTRKDDNMFKHKCSKIREE